MCKMKHQLPGGASNNSDPSSAPMMTPFFSWMKSHVRLACPLCPRRPFPLRSREPSPSRSHRRLNSSPRLVRRTIEWFQDDWSWHRNPAAAIRSGGTNKQTPVWKYFVYNKAENLSRCIIGDCTYSLKGPHTSTLACHLKKHSAEY
ncbi:hypothetical protein ANCDUO_09792, partial [Ancylostoma duodenale]